MSHLQNLDMENVAVNIMHSIEVCRIIGFLINILWNHYCEMCMQCMHNSRNTAK